MSVSLSRLTNEFIAAFTLRLRADVSPEMHLYFRHNGTVAEVIAQGLSNTSGNFARITPLAKEAAWRWIDLFHLEKLAERRYNTLSTGEQRLAESLD